MSIICVEISEQKFQLYLLVEKTTGSAFLTTCLVSAGITAFSNSLTWVLNIDS